MAREVISTNKAPGAVGPYVQAIKSNGMVYCSGQLGIDVSIGKLPEGVEAQAHCSMKNLGAILEEAGSGYKKIVKTTIFLADMNDFAAVNKIYESYFGGDFPARSCFQVAKLPLGGLVEIECIAEV
ncbi:RidA family protein [Clostridium sp. AM58-1XD]|uniref:RidA family protein n=1 Tax=Clostridium sp. AM58-1XD TaxID=2292307 RepID=UPI000E4E24A1|nr:RidA family protein [Clostridium sp. AM58-1XD]RGZ00098.1 RidA family protein [Clostridium sp. AM58-1XD]